MNERTMGSSVSEIVNWISSELAQKEVNFTENDKKNPEKLKILSMKTSEHSENVNKKINNIYSAIQKQYSGINLPSNDLKFEIARNLSEQVRNNGIKDINQINIGQATTETLLQNACMKAGISYNDLNVEINDRNVASVINMPTVALAAENIRELMSSSEQNGKYPTIIEPTDPKYAFKDDADRDDETVIEFEKKQIEDLIKEIDKHPENKDKIEAIIKNSPGGLGIDAGLRYFADRFNAVSHNSDGTETREGVKEFLKSPKEIEIFESLLKEKRNNPNFREDKFTKAYTLDIMTSFKSFELDGLDSLDDSKEYLEKYIKMKKSLKSMDKKTFKLVENNIKVMKKWQNQTDENGVSSPFNELLYADESYNAEDFLKRVKNEISKVKVTEDKSMREKISEALNDFKSDRELQVKYLMSRFFKSDKHQIPQIGESTNIGNVQNGIKNEEHDESTSSPKIKAAEKFSNLKKLMQSRAKVKGMQDCIKFAISHIQNEEDVNIKKLFMNGILETIEEYKELPEQKNDEMKFARRELFESIVENNIDNREILEKMVTIDVDAVKDLAVKYCDTSSLRAMQIKSNLIEAIGRKGRIVNQVDISKTVGSEKTVAPEEPGNR